jgi:hypothetical protein
MVVQQVQQLWLYAIRHKKMNLAELKEKTAADLNMVAKELNVTNTGGLRKQELIYKILKPRRRKMAWYLARA